MADVRQVEDAERHLCRRGRSVRRDPAEAEVRDEGLREQDGAVLLLVLLQDGGQSAADGQAGAVDGGGRRGLPCSLRVRMPARRPWNVPKSETEEISRYVPWLGSQTSMS